MSVNFLPTTPSVAVSTDSKPVDMAQLHASFVSALRSFGLDKGGSQNTILEVISPNNERGNDRNQERREFQEQLDRNDFVQGNRKQLDKSEIRSSELTAEYQDRRERNEMLRNDHSRTEPKINLQERSVSSSPHPVSIGFDSALSPVLSTIDNSAQQIPLNVSSVPSQNVQGTVAPPVFSLPSSPNVAAQIAANPLGTTQMGTIQTNAPFPLPVPTSPSPTQVFSVFTPTGRFKQSQDNSDENKENREDKEDRAGEEQPQTMPLAQPFAALEAVRTELARPIQRTALKQSQGDTSVRQVTVQPRDNVRESAKENTSPAKSIHSLLDSLPQNVTAKNSSANHEQQNQPDQAQYIKRIAAACEAAAQFAPIRMKLNLDELGTLTLRFYYRANHLSLRFDTPSKLSEKFLHENLDELKTILAKRNVNIVEIEIGS